MGKIKQGILGGFSGKVGNIVGSSWKGIDVIKSQPLSVANPRTSAQVAQRGKFGDCVAFASLINSSIIKPMWDRFAQQMSGFNSFIKENIDVFTGMGMDDPADLVISKGKMAATAVTLDDASMGDGTANIVWDTAPAGPYQHETDKAYAVVTITEVKDKVKTSSGTAVRSDGGVNIEMPDGVSLGNNCHVHVAFMRADGTIVSETSYDSKSVTS